MPTDTPKNSKDSDISVDEANEGDELTIIYESRDEQRRSFTATVTRTNKFDSGTTLTLDNGAKVFGDFYPPIVRTPAGDELRLYIIEKHETS